MAEYDKGRLYWVKLTDKFITSDTVDYLMTEYGAHYVVLYQMLCLKTVNNGGVLARELGEILVPYDVEKIQRDCKWFSEDTIRIALELYKSLGLVYENNDGLLAITDFDRLIGSQTYGAEKKAVQRQNKENLLDSGGQLSGQLSGQKVDICPPYKDKETNIEKYHKKENTKERKTTKANAFCPPTFEEVREYAVFKGREDLAKPFFEYFDEGGWVDSKGNKVISWKQKFITWCSRNDPKPNKGSPTNTPKYGNFDINEAFEAALKRTYEEET